MLLSYLELGLVCFFCNESSTVCIPRSAALPVRPDPSCLSLLCLSQWHIDIYFAMLNSGSTRFDEHATICFAGTQ
jgi:hypothetical protein